MLAVLGLYLTAFLLVAACGIALRALLEPNGRWVGASTVPLGACVAMALLYPLGYGLATTTAVPIFLGIVLATLAGTIVVRMARAPDAMRRQALRSALQPTAGEAVAIVLGLVGGILVLIPILRLGFPTTIAYSNNDGWGYAGLVDWLVHHPFPRDVTPDFEHPLTFISWSQEHYGFAIGFERIASMVAAILGREGYEVVWPVGAVAIPIATCGWASLWSTLTGSLRSRDAALVGLAVASPVLLVPFAENYMTHFVSLALWPFAAAAFLAFVRRPDSGSLLIAALATAAVIGVYPGLIPWLLPTLAVIAFARGQVPRAASAFFSHRGLATAGARAGIRLGALAVAVVVIAPLQVERAVRNLRFLSGSAGNAGYPYLRDAGYAIYGVGASLPFPLLGRVAVSWGAAIGAVLVGLAILIAFSGSLSGRSNWTRLELSAIAGSVAIVTAVAVVTYLAREERAYSAFKAVTSGGAIFAGALLLGLALASRRRPPMLRLAAVGTCLAVWLPVSASLLELTFNSRPGFRRVDVQLGRALRDVPVDARLLVEGAALDATAFQMRMMSAYMADSVAHRAIEGLGSTPTYLTTPGGAPAWRPRFPWSHVITTAPSPFGAHRVPVWQNAFYTLQAAPSLDVTPYRQTWYPAELEGGHPFAWISGPAEMVISNRSYLPERAVLRFTVTSPARPRTMAIRVGARSRAIGLRADTPTLVRVPVRAPARSTVTAVVAATPGAAVGYRGDPRALMLRIQDVQVLQR